MRRKIIILDYGSGNIKSVLNICKHLDENSEISNDVNKIKNCSHLILPGVGSFGSSIEKIKKNLPIDEILNEINIQKKSFLGICVGMQVMATKGFEFGEHDGLNLIEGTVEKLKTDKLPLPNIGWGNIKLNNNEGIFSNLNNENYFYFVHSYEFKPENYKHVIATSDYEREFVCAIQKENIIGVQFHPEKSQKSGIRLLKNFFDLK